MTDSNGSACQLDNGGGLQRLPQELKNKIHGYVLWDLIENADCSLAIVGPDERTTAHLWAFTNAFGSLEDQKDYLAASKFRGEFLRRHANMG